MRRLEELARAAVGFDAKRGDEVAMENVSFSSNAPEVKAPVMDRVMEEARALLHSQPGLMRTGMIGLCGVLLVLFVLRPVAKQVTATLKEPALLTAGAASVVLEEPISDRALEPVVEKVSLPARVLTRTQQEQHAIFERVSDHIRREPAQSTRLLEAWIGSQEEMD